MHIINQTILYTSKYVQNEYVHNVYTAGVCRTSSHPGRELDRGVIDGDGPAHTHLELLVQLAEIRRYRVPQHYMC